MPVALTYTVDGVPCSARLYVPSGPGPHPAVVLGHGLGGVAAYLAPYAQAFAQAGIAALAFDYRHFGKSGGTPRQLFSIRRQLRDWEAAIAQVRARPEVDPAWIALWGTSFGGGHAITVAARHPELRAVVVQCPAVDFRAMFVAAVRADPRRALRLTAAAVRDAIFGLVGRAAYVPLAGSADSLAPMVVALAPDDIDAMMREAAAELDEAPPFDNVLTPRFLLGVAAYRPLAAARRLQMPLWVTVADRDDIAPPHLAAAAAAAAPAGRVSHHDADHFSIYGGTHRDRALAEQVGFLKEIFAARAL